jgi:hypothetical protein
MMIDDDNNEALMGAALSYFLPVPLALGFYFHLLCATKALVSIYDVLTGTGSRTVYTHIHCEKYGYF